MPTVGSDSSRCEPGPRPVLVEDVDTKAVPVMPQSMLPAWSRRLMGRIWAPTLARTGQRFPLVVLQHGYVAVPGDCWPYPTFPPLEPLPWEERFRSDVGMNWLAQHLASHGYFVFSIDAREVTEMEDTGAADDCQLIALRAELLLSAVATLDREGYRVSDERVTLGGHSNGGRAAFYAQAWNMADAIGIDIAAVLGLDASTDWPDCLDSPPSLGTASLLSIGGSFPASLAALEAQWPTDGAVAAIDLDFQHDYLNSVWVDLTEAGHCASGSDLTYGPPRPGDFPRVARIARCAVSNFLAWRVRGSLVASTWFLDGPRALDGVNPEDIEQLEIRWPLFAPLA